MPVGDGDRERVDDTDSLAGTRLALILRDQEPALEDLEQCLVLRDVDGLAGRHAAVALVGQERRNRRSVGERPRLVRRDEPRSLQRLAPDEPVRSRPAAARPGREVVARELRAGAGQAVGRNRHDDGVRVDVGQVSGRDSKAPGRACADDDNIRAAYQAGQLPTIPVLEHHRAPICEHEHRNDAAPVFRERREAPARVPGRWLGERDVRAHVGEQPRAPRPGDRAREVEHPHAVERADRFPGVHDGWAADNRRDPPRAAACAVTAAVRPRAPAHRGGPGCGVRGSPPSARGWRRRTCRRPPGCRASGCRTARRARPRRPVPRRRRGP